MWGFFSCGGYACEMRVVSLVPSLTELVWALDPGSLAGRTRFCTEPPEAREVPVVGGTKDPDVGAIVDLRPDLVIANKEENREADVTALRAAGLDVWVTEPDTVAEAAGTITEAGRRLDRDPAARVIVERVHAELRRAPEGPAVRVFVAVWRQPLMGLGSNAYGHDVIVQAGAVNVLAGRERYPEVTADELRELAPDLVLLPDEPYRFGPQHIPEFAAVAPARVIDGKLLWWYGPRIADSLRALKAILRGASPGGV